MPTPTVRLDRLRSRLQTLSTIGADPSGVAAGGVSRFPYSEAHAQAVRTAADWMREAGLQPGCDPYGNLVGLSPGSVEWPAIILASHLDTVPHGGMFDGALGVLAGVEVAQALHEAGQQLRHPLAVVGFADEEGYIFSLGALASRCLVGDIPQDRFHSLRGRDGRTLAEALAEFAPGLPRATVPAKAGAYLELHVEQGPVLAQMGRRVAVVTTITGIARTRVVIEGQAAHAGSTPMASRRDALVGSADAILAVEALAKAAGPLTVGTVGTLQVRPGASDMIPGQVEFKIEFRTPDGERLRQLSADAEAEIRRIAARYGLACSVEAWDLRDPVPLDPGIQQVIATTIANAGHESYSMPSGGGHDAMVLARYVPSGMILVPSVGGVSHSPREWTEWEDAALGAEVLLRTVLLLDERERPA